MNMWVLLQLKIWHKIISSFIPSSNWPSLSLLLNMGDILSDAEQLFWSVSYMSIYIHLCNSYMVRIATNSYSYKCCSTWRNMTKSYRYVSIAPWGMANTSYSVGNQHIIPARWTLQNKTKAYKGFTLLNK